MQFILLSGGSGTRFWPFSNEARSKQFLRLLPAVKPGEMESMIQRIVRQIHESGIDGEVNIAANIRQRDPILSQLGLDVDIVCEPLRRNTFPAVALAGEYLSKVKGCSDEEVVIILPCDQFTDKTFYETIKKMADATSTGNAQLIAMGIPATSPLTKYGYLLPDIKNGDDYEIVKIQKFTEKPSEKEAESLIQEGAFWNAGVYSCKLGFIRSFASKFVNGDTFEDILADFKQYPDISFDYEVTEKAASLSMITHSGLWKDLGNWDALLSELKQEKVGRVSMADNENTHVINELQIPILCLDTKNLIIAASPDGILISDKKSADFLNEPTQTLNDRPMYEERRWGTYQVIDHTSFGDYETLTKRLTLNQGRSIGYQSHKYRDETWTFIDGEGIVVIDGVTQAVKRGDTVHISHGKKHALLATSPLSFIEVQAGSNLVEEDIIRYPWEWDK